jgi:hypothetical protein
MFYEISQFPPVDAGSPADRMPIGGHNNCIAEKTQGRAWTTTPILGSDMESPLTVSLQKSDWQ